MQDSQDLAGAPWRKSSYSGGTGGECVECAPLGDATWRTASYSGDTGGQCVEVAGLAGHIAVRDSKNPGGGVVVVGPRAFVAFLRGATR